MGEWRCNRCAQTFEEGPCPAAEREREAQDAVIEAAKALHKRGSTLEEMDLIDEVDMAVEDLLAAEVEG